MKSPFGKLAPEKTNSAISESPSGGAQKGFGGIKETLSEWWAKQKGVNFGREIVLRPP